MFVLNFFQGVNKTSEKVTIHNKNYQPPPPTPKPCMGKTGVILYYVSNNWKLFLIRSYFKLGLLRNLLSVQYRDMVA